MKQKLEKIEVPNLGLTNGAVAVVRAGQNLFAYVGRRHGCEWPLAVRCRCVKSEDAAAFEADITHGLIAPSSAIAELKPDGTGQIRYRRFDGTQEAIDAFASTLERLPEPFKAPAPPPAPDRDDEKPQAGPGMGR
jgi:hypothetical protein